MFGAAPRSRIAGRSNFQKRRQVAKIGCAFELYPPGVRSEDDDAKPENHHNDLPEVPPFPVGFAVVACRLATVDVSCGTECLLTADASIMVDGCVTVDVSCGTEQILLVDVSIVADGSDAWLCKAFMAWESVTRRSALQCDRMVTAGEWYSLSEDLDCCSRQDATTLFSDGGDRPCATVPDDFGSTELDSILVATRMSHIFKRQLTVLQSYVHQAQTNQAGRAYASYYTRSFLSSHWQ